MSKVSGFHDLKIIGLLNKETSLRITIEDDGYEKYIQFFEVAYFKVDDFVYDNVISCVYLLDGSTEDAALERGLEEATQLSDGSRLVSSMSQAKLKEKIQSGELRLIVVEPSLGATIFVIFKSFISDLQSELQARIGV